MTNRMIREAWDTVNPTQQQRERMRAALEAHLEASGRKGKGAEKNQALAQEEQEYFDFTLPEDPYAAKPQERTVKAGKKERRYYSSKQAKTNWPAQIAAIAAVLMVTVAGGLFLGWMSGQGKEPASVAAPQAEIAGDYKKLLDKYETAIQEKWNGEKYAAEDMSILLRDVSSTSEVGYVLRDLNGDGEDELFLTNGDVIYDLYTLYGGKLSHIFSSMERDAYYLTNGSFFSEVSSGSGGVRYDAVWYLEGTELVHGRYTLTYDPGRDAENPWFAGEGMKPFTEESAQAAINAYPHAVISFTPLSGKRVREPEKQPDDALLRLYAQKVPEAYQEYSFDKEKTFCFYDYDGDGTLELLLGAGEAVYRVLQPAAGNANQVEICQGVGGEKERYLCEGYILEGITEREGYDGIHHYYRTGDPFLSGFFSLYWHDEGEIAYQKHDPNVISEGTVTLPTVTREKAQALQKTYQRLSLDWKPLSQFPVEIPDLDTKDEASVDEALMQLYAKSIPEAMKNYSKSEEKTFCFYDCDGDGKDELLLGAGDSVYRILQPMTGSEDFIDIAAPTGEQGYAFLCQGNVFESTGNSQGLYYYEYSRIGDANGNMSTERIDFLSFDLESDTWYGEGWDMPVITQAEAEAIRGKYPRLELDWKSLSQFPVPVTLDTLEGTALFEKVFMSIATGDSGNTQEALTNLLDANGFQWSNVDGVIECKDPDAPDSCLSGYLSNQNGAWEVFALDYVKKDGEQYRKADVDFRRGKDFLIGTDIVVYVGAQVETAEEMREFVFGENDSLKIKALIMEFTEAYFNRDEIYMREHVTSDFGKLELYSGEYAPSRKDIGKILGLPLETEWDGMPVALYVECMIPPETDSYSRLTFGVDKEDGVWKVQFCGLEK